MRYDAPRFEPPPSHVGHGPAILPGFAKLGELTASDDDLPAHCRVLGGDPDTLREWVFVTADNSFFNLSTGQGMPRTSFDLAMAARTPSVELTKADGDTEIKKFPASRTLVEFLGGVSVSAPLYFPGAPALFTFESIPFVNRYRENSIPVADPNWKAHPAWQVVRNHIQNVLPEGAEHIVGWLAHNVQKPGVKILWVPLLFGVEGDGKTTIAHNVLGAAMGSQHVKPVSPEALHSDFNGWATDAAVRVLEEIRLQGERRTAVMERLKAVITNNEVEIVKKGADGRPSPNFTNFIGCTNHPDALALTAGDRRWAVWKTRFRDREHLLAETGAEYFDDLHAAIQNHPEVIRGWLLNVDLTDFDRTSPPPMSAAKLAMIEASRSPVASDVFEAIALGGPGVTADVLATDCLNAIVKEQGGRPLNTRSLHGTLAEAGWERHDLTVKWGGRNRRLYFKREAFRGVEGTELSRVLRLRLENESGGPPSDFGDF